MRGVSLHAARCRASGQGVGADISDNRCGDGRASAGQVAAERANCVCVCFTHIANIRHWAQDETGSVRRGFLEADGINRTAGMLAGMQADCTLTAGIFLRTRHESRVTLQARGVGQRRDGLPTRHRKAVEVFYWIDRDFGYALSGQVDRATIRALVDAAYRQMAGRAGA